MFDWFGKLFSRRNYSTESQMSDMEKIGNDMSKVIPFPELKSAPEPDPEPKKPAVVFYRIGVTDNNRVSLQVGYSEITMNRQGVENMISQLSVFRDQLTHEEE